MPDTLNAGDAGESEPPRERAGALNDHAILDDLSEEHDAMADDAAQSGDHREHLSAEVAQEIDGEFLSVHEFRSHHSVFREWAEVREFRTCPHDLDVFAPSPTRLFRTTIGNTEPSSGSDGGSGCHDSRTDRQSPTCRAETVDGHMCR